MRPQSFAPPRQLGERITLYLHQCRLYRVNRLPHIDIDWSLITSLVERWQSSTHTFHLPNCEMTITLDRKSTRLNSSHVLRSRMPSSA